MTNTPGEHGHEHAPVFRDRIIGTVFTGHDEEITVGHVYDSAAEPCPGCGGPCVSAGMIALDVLADGPALLTPEEALLLANRLTRAANLVLETMEDAPDAEREAARFGAVPDYPPDS